MKDWRKGVISPKSCLKDAIHSMEESCLQVTLVLDENDRLLGTVTDGDIRRAILRNLNLDSPVTEVMATQFTTASPEDSRDEILEVMHSKDIRHVPVVAADGRMVGLKILMDLVQEPQRDNWVVLMAGGLGTRLQPLTNDCPKPLLKVGGKPVLETIMNGFMDYGFRNFFLSVNYKAEMIEDYFGDGSRFGVNISYLRETRKLGTGGCLSLFDERPDKTFLLMNGDLLTRVNFEQMLDFHHEHQSIATMGIREYEFQVPFGTVNVDKHRITGLTEKPVHKFFVNAGVYALEPKVLNFVEKECVLDMPDLFSRIMDRGMETSAFPIHEYWLDIGRMHDFERAENDFEDHFNHLAD